MALYKTIILKRSNMHSIMHACHPTAYILDYVTPLQRTMNYRNTQHWISEFIETLTYTGLHYQLLQYLSRDIRNIHTLDDLVDANSIADVLRNANLRMLLSSR